MHDQPRIVSLFPAATEMIGALGLADALVGVSHECNWPPAASAVPRLTRSRIDSAAPSADIDRQVQSLLAAGEPLYEFDAAALAELRPTLVVTQSQCDVCALDSSVVEAVVRSAPSLANAQVLALNPASLDDVLRDIELIGRAARVESAADFLVASLRDRIAAVRQLPAGVAERRPRVAVIEWIEPLMVAGHWTPELVTLAGGDYGLASAGQPSPYVPWDQFVHNAPERIVVAPCGFDLARTRREAATLAAMPSWGDLPAVRSGQVLLADGDAWFNRPGPRLVDALEMLGRWLHEVPLEPSFAEVEAAPGVTKMRKNLSLTRCTKPPGN